MKLKVFEESLNLMEVTIVLTKLEEKKKNKQCKINVFLY